MWIFHILLLDFADFLKVDVTVYQNKGQRALAKKIRDEFENVVEQHENKFSFQAETEIGVAAEKTERLETTHGGEAKIDEDYRKAKQ